jgi:hypothetical protein
MNASRIGLANASCLLRFWRSTYGKCGVGCRASARSASWPGSRGSVAAAGRVDSPLPSFGAAAVFRLHSSAPSTSVAGSPPGC